MNALKPQMTRTDLNETLNAVADNLGVGPRSIDVSSTYVDYVALRVACFATSTAERVVQETLLPFLARFGWTELSVTAHPKINEITVIMHKSNIVSGGNERLPCRRVT